MNNAPREMLIEIIAEFGQQIVDDLDRFEDLLRSRCHGHKRELNGLLVSITEGVPKQLLESKGTDGHDEALDRCTNHLHDSVGIRRDLARWSVESWALALRVVDKIRYKIDFRCPACGACGVSLKKIAGRTIKCPKCKSKVNVSEDGQSFTLEPKAKTVLAPVGRSPDTTEVDQPRNPGTRRLAFANSIGMVMRLVQPGTFLMGNGPNKHEITIQHPYYFGIYQVTQREYAKVMGSNPSFFRDAGKPVESVSWKDAVAFCQVLSNHPVEKSLGRSYRLPSEAEWEYACRAGSTTAYCFGDNQESLCHYGWFGDKLMKGTRRVGEKTPNAWGFYDMHGNVSEWCSDLIQNRSQDSKFGTGDLNYQEFRVLRGGSWFQQARDCQSSHRYAKNSADYRDNYIGFRVALDLSDTKS